MTPRATRLIPDPLLARPAASVADVEDPRVTALCIDLVDSMRAAGHSVGVAAPQIGIGLRAICFDVTGHPRAVSCHGEVALVNPEVLLAHGREIGREGCMSVPDLTGDVIRHTRLVVRGWVPGGQERVLECDAFEARVVQHELDHLDGLVFLDRVVSPERIFRRRRYR